MKKTKTPGGKSKTAPIYENPKVKILRACEIKALTFGEISYALNFGSFPELGHEVLDKHLADLVRFKMLQEKQYAAKPSRSKYKVTLCGLNVLKALNYDPAFFD